MTAASGTGFLRAWAPALAGLVLLLPAPAAMAYSAAAGARVEMISARRHLESYEIPQARQALETLRRADPGSEGAAYLEGALAFYTGDYRRADEVFRRLAAAKALLPEDELPRLAADTLAATAGLSARRSEHFVLLLDEKKDWVLAEPALESLENAYRNLGAYFGHYPDEPLRVEIYPDPDAFQKTSSLTVKDIEGSGAVAICKFNKLLLLSPRQLVWGYRWLDTLAHEYIHWLVVRLTGNGAPIWVHEGMAKHFEKLWENGPAGAPWPAGDALLAQALEEGKLISFEAMDPSLVRLNSVREVALAFAECDRAVAFILERVGREGLLRFLERIKTLGRRQTREALHEAVGLDFTAFEEAWKAYLGGLGLKKQEYLRMAEYRLAGGESDEESLVREIQSMVAMNHLSLGDSLRRGGRLRPALAEYKRAARESPGSPYILNKVGLTAGLLEDWDTSLEYLDRAARLAPDYPLTYLNQARTGFSRGRWDEAAAWCREYRKINPFDPEAHLLEGRSLIRGGRREEALAALERAGRFYPEDENLRLEIETLRKDNVKSGG